MVEEHLLFFCLDNRDGTWGSDDSSTSHRSLRLSIFTLFKVLFTYRVFVGLYNVLLKQKEKKSHRQYIFRN